MKQHLNDVRVPFKHAMKWLTPHAKLLTVLTPSSADDAPGVLSISCAQSALPAADA